MNNRNRSMPLSAFAPLLDVPDVQCFSLQKGDGGHYTDASPPPDRLPDFTADWQDFSDSAAIVRNAWTWSLPWTHRSPT